MSETYKSQLIYLVCANTNIQSFEQLTSKKTPKSKKETKKVLF